ncbi:hypothetical protein, variant 1 [Aphanomyces astaci]|uniref:Transcription initiation factor IIE subunit alpha N-terminal domain-containing protein n=1 Tax=Aphanomyces astaci TaxID=112090 RepID=W4GWU6_APHAT|nr:hypothetical protein, variant 1 [Aphanomyces astaci]ETV83494.1 hypothetical protein, variant 1 [Aphanomyces astaci]|eukprot:XP_009826926.1 hypothetical protein, variant 1 [Aphanomyces astaci]
MPRPRSRSPGVEVTDALKLLPTYVTSCSCINDDHREELNDKKMGGASKATYWYIDYKYFVDVVRYRLYLIRTYLMEAESLEIERQTYRCDNDDCGREYTALEAQKLLTPEIHEFFCGHCNSKLLECDNNERLQSAQSLLKKYTAQVNRAEDLHDSINECLKKIQEFLNSGQALPSNLPSENRAAGRGGDSVRVPAGRGGGAGGGGGGGGNNRANEPQMSLLYGNRAPEVVVSISTENKPRNEVKLEPTSAVKALPAHLQGSKMSNDMASKYKQNNVAPPASVFGTSQLHVKDDDPSAGRRLDDEDDAMKAEIILDEHSGGGQTTTTTTSHGWNDYGVDMDDDGFDMDWENCDTSQEDYVDPHYVHELVTVQGFKHELLNVTDADIERMTQHEYVDYYHKCKLVRSRLGQQRQYA